MQQRTGRRIEWLSQSSQGFGAASQLYTKALDFSEDS
jgi:hypothetical protein